MSTGLQINNKKTAFKKICISQKAVNAIVISLPYLFSAYHRADREAEVPKKFTEQNKTIRTDI